MPGGSSNQWPVEPQLAVEVGAEAEPEPAALSQVHIHLYGSLFSGGETEIGGPPLRC